MKTNTKTNTATNLLGCCHTLLIGIAAAAMLSAVPGTARGQAFQVYVVSYGNGDSDNGYIGEYTVSNGMVTGSNPDLVPGLTSPWGIAVSGSNLYYTTGNSTGNYSVGVVTLNSAGTGTVLNSQKTLVSLGYVPTGIAVSGSNLFVTDFYGNQIDEYNATSGSAVKTPLITTGLSGTNGIALDPTGSDLFAVNNYGETVTEYSTAHGSAVPSGGNPLISGLDDSPFGCVVDPSGKYLYVVNNGNGQDEGTVCEYSTANGSAASGGNPLIPAGSFKNSDAIGLDPTGTDLFVTNSGGPNTIGEFYASNGGAVNTSLIITGLDDPIGIVVVPEPASTGLLGVAAVGLLRRRVRRQQPYPPSST